MNDVLDGQAVPVKILRAILRSGRIAHAYLFKGPTGSGKSDLAREFSKALLCMGESRFAGSGSESGLGSIAKDNAGLSCGLCRSCQAFDKDSHPDLYPIEKDGTTIKIKASHGMLKEALTKPYLSRRKVFVIYDAENLTAEAANALLKLLEEPPPYVIFILTTANETAIPSTVVSRCQVITFRPLPSRAIAEFLEKEHGVPKDESHEIAAFSNGSVERALWLLSQGEEITFFQRALFEDIHMNSPVELALKYSKADPEEKGRMLSALEIEFARNLLRAVQHNQGICDEDSESTGGDGSGGSHKGGSSNVLLHQSLAGLRAVMDLRQSLNANTNAFLAFCVLFMDLKRVFGL